MEELVEMADNGGNRAVTEVANYMLAAKRVLIVTGAGLSADSGMPTYRGIGGLYGDLPVRDGLAIEDILSGYTMKRDPALVWEYLGHVAEAFFGAKPNCGHDVIAAMDQHFEKVLVLTQNVDGFHAEAGSKHIVDIHGDIHDLACLQCSYKKTDVDLQTLAMPPTCPECGAILRPGVTLFGEMLDEAKLATLQREMAKGFDLAFSIGTSSLFPYITQPILLTRQMGGKTVEINPGATDLSDIVDVRFRAKAAATLEAIWESYQALSG